MVKKQIILYGPPGTGKTFGTRQLSVDLIETIQVKKDIYEEPEDYSDDNTIIAEQYSKVLKVNNPNFITIQKAVNQLPNVIEKPIKGYLAFHSKDASLGKKTAIAWLSYPRSETQRFKVYLRPEGNGKYPETLTSRAKDYKIGSHGHPEFRIEDEHDTKLAIELIKYAYNNF